MQRVREIVVPKRDSECDECIRLGTPPSYCPQSYLSQTHYSGADDAFSGAV